MAYAEHRGVTFLPVLVFLLLSCSPDHLVRAQTGDQQFSNSSYARFSPTVAIIVVIMIATFFFLAFFSIYIRYCSGASSGSAAGGVLSLRSRRAAAAGAPSGLDPSVIETFPTFTYSEVKEHKLGKGALECAVCLNEFEEDETLRFIPRCDHVFHPECIDAWLLSHVTCPVCRADLVPAQPAAGDNHDEPVVVQVPESTQGDTTHLETSNSRINDEIVIQVDDVNTNQPQLVNRTPRNQNPPRSWSIRRLRSFGFGKLRLDSIGHGNDNNDTMVVVQPGENLERFTLRLPEQVRKEMMLRRSKSYIGTSSLARSGSSGAGGSRSSRRMNDRRSDRWAFLTRALSMPTTSWSSTKVVADHTGEGGSNNSRVIKGPVKLPSFKCLEPKAVNIDQTDAAALFPAGDPPGVGSPSQSVNNQS